MGYPSLTTPGMWTPKYTPIIGSTPSTSLAPGLVTKRYLYGREKEYINKLF